MEKNRKNKVIRKQLAMISLIHMKCCISLFLLYMCYVPLTYGLVGNDYYNNVYDMQTDREISKANVKRFPFLIPNIRPQTPELYLCTPIKIDSSKSYYIVSFEPNATMNVAHHMLLFGCGEPGSKNQIWNCGEMASKITEETASPCDVNSQSQILYAWARDAPELELPPEVGFKVGRDTTIQYMVLQVHYAHIDMFKDKSVTDNSGVFIHYTEKPKKKLAGVLLMGTAGIIPPMTTEYMETACEIRENKTLHPFAYRVHTHSLGKVVTGYRVRPDSQGHHYWTVLGRRNPLTPQMFYPIMNNKPIVQGDIIAARCIMKSTRKRYTEVGATNEDEMCNFYLMYYVEHGDPLKLKYCFSQGPPHYYWHNADAALNNIPDVETNSYK